MRLLNYSQWIELMETIFNNMLIILQRAKAFSGIVSDVVGIAAGRTKAPTPIHSPTQDMAHPLEEPKHLNVSISEDVDVMITLEDHGKAMNGLRQLLFFLSDHANDRCMKVVQAQGNEGFLERLSPTEFVSLFHLVEKFNSDCEELCGREEHVTSRMPAQSYRKPGEYLMVEGEKFAVVGTVLMLLKMVVEYCQCAEDIPSVTPDLLSRLIELLNMFNSRTCQLVLGAGALELVGLTTISTKNLALASRCLQLVVFYMPKIRAHFECKLPNKSANMLKHFDAIVKDYKGHVEEISNKLVTIMESMVDTQISRWEVKAPMPSSCFRAICKQMAKLHEAIIDILPQDQVKSIFLRINQTFKNVLRQKLTHLNVINNGGPQHGLVTSDLTFYGGSFKTLRGLEELAQDVRDVWDKR